MIREDAENFQRQLVHLFRVFEVEAAVSIHENGSEKDDYGVNVVSTDAQFMPRLLPEGNQVRPKKSKKKDVLSG